MCSVDKLFENCESIHKKIHIFWKIKDYLGLNFNIVKNGTLKLKELNPDYEFIVYDDLDIENYLKEQLSSTDYELIKNKHIVEKTDLARVLLIYNEGGIYSDVDRLCNIPLKKVIKPGIKCIIPFYKNDDFSQDIIISCKGNPFLKRTIELNLERRRQGIGHIYYLGPVTYMNAITELLLGSQHQRQPGRDVIKKLTDIINQSEFLDTHIENPPFNTIIYNGPDTTFDKEEFYIYSDVKPWN